MALQATVMVTKMIGLEFSRYLQFSANNFESIFASKVVGFLRKQNRAKNMQNRQTNKKYSRLSRRYLNGSLKHY